MFKKLIIVVMVILTVSFLFAACEGSGSAGTKGLKFELLNDDTYAVMKDDSDDKIEEKLKGTVKIPEYHNNLKVTKIKAGAFENCEKLTKIEIPDSVAIIEQDAFKNTGIYLSTSSDSIVYADKWAVGFRGIVTNAEIKEGTVGIANGAFGSNSIDVYDYTSRNNDLASVTIPVSVRNIGDYAFYALN